MVEVITQKPALTDWSVASRAIAGESVSGDLYLVKPFAGGTLLAVVDGMGHGREASLAAQAAIRVLDQFACEPLIALVNRCHQALQPTRGVAMTLAALNARESSMAWIGIGNVAGRLFRADPRASHPSENVLLRAGVVGYRLPTLHVSVIPIASWDLLVFTTDGVGEEFTEEIRVRESLPPLARRILDRHAKESDDALVLVVRYLGATTGVTEN